MKIYQNPKNYVEEKYNELASADHFRPQTIDYINNHCGERHQKVDMLMSLMTSPGYGGIEWLMALEEAFTIVNYNRRMQAHMDGQEPPKFLDLGGMAIGIGAFDNVYNIESKELAAK